jgi:hypothetical protein
VLPYEVLILSQSMTALPASAGVILGIATANFFSAILLRLQGSLR